MKIILGISICIVMLLFVSIIIIGVRTSSPNNKIYLEIEVPYPHIIKALVVNDITVSKENRAEYDLILISGKKYEIVFYFRDEEVITKKIINYIPTKEKYQYLKVTGELNNG